MVGGDGRPRNTLGSSDRGRCCELGERGRWVRHRIKNGIRLSSATNAATAGPYGAHGSFASTERLRKDRLRQGSLGIVCFGSLVIRGTVTVRRLQNSLTVLRLQTVSTARFDGQ